MHPIAVDPESHHLPGSCRTQPELPTTQERVPRRWHHLIQLDRLTRSGGPHTICGDVAGWLGR
ncbi:hypothetical protein, partial [Mycobacteroides abscessus]|uniref:hypothetical protein n=1 Tax=Mycobacteroides abscessus TaxID=36809 RepID=UPI001A96DBC5